MQSCLKSCGDCASAKNLPGCRRTGTRKSRAPSGVPRVIDGVHTSTKPSPSIVRRMPATAVCVTPEVPLHPVAAHVEPAVAEADVLVDVLLVELERERRRAREDAELVDLDLDLAGREVRVHGAGFARDDLALGLDDELVAQLVCRRRTP